MDPIGRFYDLLLKISRPLLPFTGLLPPKVAEAIRGRREAARNARAWAAETPRGEEPLLWLHAASAGELAGAVPVIGILRERSPDLKVAITVSSPSALSGARKLNPDFAGYAPLDTLSESGRMIDALAPDALVFAKLDIWPGLSHAAHLSGVPLGLINGTVRPDSSRLRSPTRQFLRPTYGRLDSVGVVATPDAEALALLGVDADRIRITGDAAFDQALARVEEAKASGRRSLPSRSPGRVRLVAGSTWPADEGVLIEAAREIGAPLDLILVPHEPSAEALDRIDAACRAAWGRTPRRWSRLEPESDEGSDLPLVVDTVGRLAELYLEADLSFVGGAFDATGLHSVIEPAAAGLPVFFGPLHDRREADDLLASGGAEVLTPADATEKIHACITDEARRRAAGAAARAYVESGAGAARANGDLVEELLALGLSRRTPRSR
ncbi:MAG: glycosyltransferase N-terminal domain-containing protein [Gemmatimonadota bacterium]